MSSTQPKARSSQSGQGTPWFEKNLHKIGANSVTKAPTAASSIRFICSGRSSGLIVMDRPFQACPCIKVNQCALHRGDRFLVGGSTVRDCLVLSACVLVG